MAERSGIGRLYIEPEPERGAHGGYRGHLVADELGVHISTDCEHLCVDNDSQTEDWPMGSWFGVEFAVIVPWHRVYLVEWGNEHAAELERELARNGTAASGDRA